MNTVTKYKVSIFGESYYLVSDESQEHITSAARLVDSCMREIAEKSQITESKRIAVLVALQLASKALTNKDILDRQQEQSEKLLQLLDEELGHFAAV